MSVLIACPLWHTWTLSVDCFATCEATEFQISIRNLWITNSFGQNTALLTGNSGIEQLLDLIGIQTQQCVWLTKKTHAKLSTGTHLVAKMQLYVSLYILKPDICQSVNIMWKYIRGYLHATDLYLQAFFYILEIIYYLVPPFSFYNSYSFSAFTLTLSVSYSLGLAAAISATM